YDLSFGNNSKRRATVATVRRSVNAPAIKSGLSGVGRRQDHGPEYLVFGAWSIARRYAQFCDTALEHVGAVRGRVAPAGKRFRQRMIAGRDVLDRHGRGIAAGGKALGERRADVVVHFVGGGH